MKVVALGGAGRYCRPALEILAKGGLATEIVIAGRGLASAEAQPNLDRGRFKASS